MAKAANGLIGAIVVAPLARSVAVSASAGCACAAVGVAVGPAPTMVVDGADGGLWDLLAGRAHQALGRSDVLLARGGAE